ncbi:MAG: DUF502 domain-containing protein [Alphaproteobacteria bacterium]|nr:DUF502 domain-containing protein [Alphaproteobacteria bacterium]
MSEKKSNIQEDAINKDVPDPDSYRLPQRSVMTRLRAYLLTGIVVTAPISITIYLTYIFLTFIDENVGRLLPDEWKYQYFGGYYSGTAVPGLGLIIAVIFFVAVGWLATNFLGRLIIKFYEFILDRMPVIRTVYSATKQIFETIMASQSQAFREAVMLEYPRRGVWSIGFVTGVTEGEVQRITSEETVNVFVPTTPNPTSGYLLFVPKKELTYLNMTVEEAVKLVVSAGIITPPDRKVLVEDRDNEVKSGKKDK